MAAIVCLIKVFIVSEACLLEHEDDFEKQLEVKISVSRDELKFQKDKGCKPTQLYLCTWLIFHQ